jgi:murein DD-endopeptidase MepM/ murein hydrolase activator NlpD
MTWRRSGTTTATWEIAILLLVLLAPALASCSGGQIVCDYGSTFCRGHPYRVYSYGRVVTQHEGIDFAGHVGAPVISASYGEVVMAQEAGGCGGTVAVKTEIMDRQTGKPQPLFLRYHHVVPAKDIRYGMEVVPGQLIATMQNPNDIPGRGNCIIEPHLHFALATSPDSDWGHRNPHAHWLNGKLTCYRPGMTVPRDKFVSPIPCENN